MLFDFSNTPFRMIGADEWLRRIAADTGRTLDDAAQRGRDLGGARHRAAMRAWFAHEPFPVPWRACAGRRSCRRPRRRRGRAAARQGPRAVPPSARRSDVPRSGGRVRGVEGRKGVHTDFDGAGRRAVPFRVTTADGRFEWTLRRASTTMRSVRGGPHGDGRGVDVDRHDVRPERPSALVTRSAASSGRRCGPTAASGTARRRPRRRGLVGALPRYRDGERGLADVLALSGLPRVS